MSIVNQHHQVNMQVLYLQWLCVLSPQNHCTPPDLLQDFKNGITYDPSLFNELKEIKQ